MRVVSLLPSATEIVCALGHGAELVGRSAECDYPSEVRRLPVVMRARSSDALAPSAVIDERVRAARARDESLYTIDLDRLRELAPDLLLTQDLCGVCSVTDSEVEEACATAGVRPRIVSLTPRTLAEVWTSVVRVADALGDRDAGARISAELRARTVATSSVRSRVAVVEWLDPPFLAGLWTPEIVGAAGGVAVGPRAGEPGVRSSWPDIAALSPDLLLLSPCSFSVERTRGELERGSVAGQITSLRPPLGIFLADEAYFSRPGPRLAEGVELVRHLLNRSRRTPALPFVRWPDGVAEAAA
jgi:iron complex transport system substrate-binding protein